MSTINRIILKIIFLTGSFLLGFAIAGTVKGSNVDESRVLQPYVDGDSYSSSNEKIAENPALKIVEPDQINKSNVSIKDSVNIESTETTVNHSNDNDIGLVTEHTKIINKDLYNYVDKIPSSINMFGLDSKLHNPKLVKMLYENKNMDFLWLKNSVLTDFGHNLIKSIGKSDQNALPPDLYHFASFSTLESGQKIYDPIPLDVLLTDAFITYKSHLTNGIVLPKKQFPTWTLPPRKIDFAEQYDTAKKQGDFNKVLDVDSKDYIILRKEYNRLKNEPIDPDFKIISAKKLVLGDRGNNVAVLREKLGASVGNVFDNELLGKVIAYQEKNHLKTDGVVGQNTIKLLNTSTQDLVDALKINMERMRWVYVPKDINYIWVNIPGYKMAVRNEENFIFESNVIVGTKKRQTPIFSNTLKYVVLNPYWNVPKTIFKEDKLPKLKNDPSSLGSEMQVVNAKTGEVVDSADVDWETGGAGYRLRELPGKSNSLGKVKFLFPNKYDIYLHDTPHRNLFSKETRSFSSGCVRVERANDLMYFLLEKMNWSANRIKDENNKPTEKWVPLSEDMNYPVFINYYTIWVDSNKSIKQSRDIYGYDDKMLSLYTRTINNYNK